LTSFSLANLAVVLAYVGAVAALGSLLGRRQKDASDYFLADHAVPWWAARSP
jgi:Na+/proline symporter